MTSSSRTKTTSHKDVIVTAFIAVKQAEAHVFVSMLRWAGFDRVAIPIYQPMTHVTLYLYIYHPQTTTDNRLMKGFQFRWLYDVDSYDMGIG